MNNCSVVIITFNEERNIERCIRSAQKISDDIIVVDSFSEDRTPEICKQLGIRFYQKEWLGYGATKNHAVSLAKNDWIFSLDADEEISDLLAVRIKSILTSPKYDAYIVCRLTNYCGKWIYHGEWFPDYHTRLFKKSNARWDDQEVHEQLEFSFKPSLQKIKKAYLNHYTTYAIQEHIQKADKYSSLAAIKMKRKGKKATFVKLYIGPTLKFVFNYFFRGGFLDGFYGFTIAKISAFENYLKYAKLKELS